LLKFKNKLRAIPALAEEQSLQFLIKVVNKQQQVPHNLQSAFCVLII